MKLIAQVAHSTESSSHKRLRKLDSGRERQTESEGEGGAKGDRLIKRKEENE